jgi:hypothetical protein
VELDAADVSGEQIGWREGDGEQRDRGKFLPTLSVF